MNLINPVVVSVGIPAYNESKNIQSLLEAILSQAGTNFTLKEIIVISDGSNDDTVFRAMQVVDARITVIDSKERKGKTGRCNELFDMFVGDVLIQFDADMRLQNSEVISNLISKMQEGDYEFVCANLTPLAPQTFVEKLAVFGVNMWKDILDKLGPEKTMLHHCVGGARLFTRLSLQNFRFPLAVETGEDVYTYLSLFNQGVKIGFADRAIVSYRLASTTKDYIRQMHRFLTTNQTMFAEFGEQLYRSQNVITTKIKLQAFIAKLLHTNPLITLGYALLQIYTRLTLRNYKRTKFWDIATSTK